MKWTLIDFMTEFQGVVDSFSSCVDVSLSGYSSFYPFEQRAAVTCQINFPFSGFKKSFFLNLESNNILHLLCVSADLDGIGDKSSRLLSCHTNNVFKRQWNLWINGKDDVVISLHFPSSPFCTFVLCIAQIPLCTAQSFFTISLPLFLETHCCRNGGSSLRGRGAPGGGCPAGVHTDSLRKNHVYNPANIGPSSNKWVCLSCI